MKLGLLVDRFDPSVGGMEGQSDALLRRAVLAGDGGVVACLEGKGPPGVETILVPAPSRRPARDRVLAEEGPRRLRDAGCDCVLAIRHALSCDVYLPRGGLVGDALAAADASRGGASVLRRIARVFSGKHRFFAEAESTMLSPREGPRVIALSRALADRMKRLYPGCASRVVVIPNGVDAKRFDPGPLGGVRREMRAGLGLSDALVGLLVGHNTRLKGLETAIRAMARPEVTGLSPPFALVVVGRSIEPSLLRLARRLGVSDRLRVHGPVPDPRPLYATADLLVHPTWHDPCSNVCLEALAMGLPVITTPQNGASEIMGMQGGIVIEEPGNPESLAVAIRVLADPALRASTAEDARYVAEKNRQSTRLDQVLDVCRAAAARTAGA
jgi:UDP-glucose:(heptosyl)LPS alpha-1,3-glucosyltransferase